MDLKAVWRRKFSAVVIEKKGNGELEKELTYMSKEGQLREHNT